VSKNESPVIKSKSRPDISMQIPKDVTFHYAGQTGWRRNRIKNGSYQAEMVQTERGPTYLIKRESLLANLSTNTLSSASQERVSHQATEFVQELLRPFVSELGEVREELGAERARRQMAEERIAALQAELEALREARESPQTVEEEPERAERAPAR
jgi:hypothetical protein